MEISQMMRAATGPPIPVIKLSRILRGATIDQVRESGVLNPPAATRER